MRTGRRIFSIGCISEIKQIIQQVGFSTICINTEKGCVVPLLDRKRIVSSSIVVTAVMRPSCIGGGFSVSAASTALGADTVSNKYYESRICIGRS